MPPARSPPGLETGRRRQTIYSARRPSAAKRPAPVVPTVGVRSSLVASAESCSSTWLTTLRHNGAIAETSSGSLECACWRTFEAMKLRCTGKLCSLSQYSQRGERDAHRTRPRLSHLAFIRDSFASRFGCRDTLDDLPRCRNDSLRAHALTKAASRFSCSRCCRRGGPGSPALAEARFTASRSATPLCSTTGLRRAAASSARTLTGAARRAPTTAS